MIKLSLAPAAANLLALSSSAWALECPVLTPVEDPVMATAISEFLPTGTDLEAPDAIESAVFNLQRAGVPDDLIVDNLIAVYCTSIAALEGVSDADKEQRVAAFSQRASESVFGAVD